MTFTYQNGDKNAGILTTEQNHSSMLAKTISPIKVKATNRHKKCEKWISGKARDGIRHKPPGTIPFNLTYWKRDFVDVLHYGPAL